MFVPEAFLHLLRVDHGGLRFGMAHQLLEDVQRHPAVQPGRGEGMPELVRENVQICPAGDLADDILQRMGADRGVWRLDADEQCVGVVLAGVDVLPHGNKGLRVEINNAFLIALAVADQNGTVLPVDVRQADVSALRDATAGGEQKVNQRLFPDALDVPPQRLQLFHAERFPALRVEMDLLHVRARVPHEVFVGYQPPKKAVECDPDALQVTVGRVPLLLELEEVDADVVGPDVLERLFDSVKEV